MDKIVMVLKGLLTILWMVLKACLLVIAAMPDEEDSSTNTYRRGEALGLLFDERINSSEYMNRTK